MSFWNKAAPVYKRVLFYLGLSIILIFLISIRKVNVTSGDVFERYCLVYADESYAPSDDGSYQIISHSFSIEYQSPTLRFIPVAANVQGTICFENTPPASFDFRGKCYESEELFVLEPIIKTDDSFSYEYQDISGWIVCMIPFFLSE